MRACWAISGPSPATTEMKIPINLASRPFRRDRAMVVASIAVCLLLAGTLATLISLALADRAQLADVRNEVNQLNRRIRAAQKEHPQSRILLRRGARMVADSAD